MHLPFSFCPLGIKISTKMSGISFVPLWHAFLLTFLQHQFATYQPYLGLFNNYKLLLSTSLSCMLLINPATSNIICWEFRDSNLGPLGMRCKHYVCAMHPYELYLEEGAHVRPLAKRCLNWVGGICIGVLDVVATAAIELCTKLREVKSFYEVFFNSI